MSTVSIPDHVCEHISLRHWEGLRENKKKARHRRVVIRHARAVSERGSGTNCWSFFSFRVSVLQGFLFYMTWLDGHNSTSCASTVPKRWKDMWSQQNNLHPNVVQPFQHSELHDMHNHRESSRTTSITTRNRCAFVLLYLHALCIRNSAYRTPPVMKKKTISITKNPAKEPVCGQVWRSSV